jgi:hypothetical protein
MRRLARWALNALTVLSLLLCVATAVLWVRGYWLEEGYARLTPEPRDYIQVSARDACLWLYRNRGAPAAADTARGTFHYRTFQGNPDGGSPVLGFSFTRRTSRWRLGIPCWCVCGLSLALPAVRSRAAWRARCARRRECAGRCRHCSYDLTGNVSGVCPECGMEIPKSSAEFSN